MRHYSNLQAMRGIAALMVVLIHSIALPKSVGMGWLAPFAAKYGPAGVDLFFVISGFIITMTAVHASQGAGSRLNIARVFAVKRILRIYPVYWVALICAVVLSHYVVLAPDSTAAAKPFWRLFFLLEQRNDKIVAAWTLRYEMFFYFVVTVVLIFFPKNVFKGLAIWSAIMLPIIVYLWNLKSAWMWSPMASPMLLEFMCGIAVAYVIHRGIRISAPGALTLGILWFLVGAEINSTYANWHHMVRALCFAPASAMIICAMVSFETDHGWTTPKPLQNVGNASYSIYIWHELIFLSLLEIWMRTGVLQTAVAPIVWLFGIAAVVFWGFFSYRKIERPLLEKGKKLLLSSWGPAKFPVRGGVYNSAFLVVLAIPPIAAWNSTFQLLPTAAQAAAAPVKAPHIVGPSDVVDRTMIQLGDTSAGTLRVEVTSKSGGKFLVGYHVSGVLTQVWTSFSVGKSELVLDIPSNVDLGHFWLAKDGGTKTDARIADVGFEEH